jgi:hypothetical protein
MKPQPSLPSPVSGGRTTSRGSASDRPAARRAGLLSELKLLFAALGAGGRVVPLGDNHRTARLLAEYAATLRRV